MKRVFRWIRAWLRQRRIQRRTGRTLAQLQRQHHAQEKAKRREIGYTYHAPLSKQLRPCRIVKRNPRRPWVEFWGGPTIQRRWGWIE